MNGGFLVGGGDMGKRIRAFDWVKTPVGDASTWPVSLRVARSVMLNSAHPMFIWWNRDHLTNFYNDAYAEILGDKHPGALGKAACEAWSDIWASIEPLMAKVFKTGKPVYMKDLRLVMNRRGYEEETYF